jgi:hypothetical protein
MSIDNSSSKYIETMKKVCNGKCSDNFSIICNFSDDMNAPFACPQMGKDYNYMNK